MIILTQTVKKKDLYSLCPVLFYFKVLSLKLHFSWGGGGGWKLYS